MSIKLIIGGEKEEEGLRAIEATVLIERTGKVHTQYKGESQRWPGWRGNQVVSRASGPHMEIAFGSGQKTILYFRTYKSVDSLGKM